ncbi:MAG: permease [Proteobacteria bacterium]|nr:permease [Pseudomonadota bacterium]
MDILVSTLQSGAASLASYLAAHVLLCLVPAFFIAGALAALVPQQSIIRFLGPDAPKTLSYPAAAGAGSLLAVCSCTIQPLFAGIYSKGAGLGPAITFLFFAPAANILALSYTGVALGADFAIARIVLALCFGVGIGLLMALIYRREDAARTANNAAFADRGHGSVTIARQTLVFLAVLVALLIVGTLKVDWLSAPLLSAIVPWDGASSAQALLDRWLPINALKGEEGLSLQGLALIMLLLAIGLAAWRGLGQVDRGVNRLTHLTLGLTSITLVFAALIVRADGAGLALTLTGRSVAVALLCASLIPLARRFELWDMQQWLWETWRFIKMIFPLLVVGVFLVGVIRNFIEPEWVEFIAGSNTVLANLAGVVFGVFMYFPTLVEVPIAKMFLSLGMHPGPLIAYLMADPELSLQSILITSAIIGKLKAWTYVGLVALFSTAAGLTYGAWVDGTPLTTLALIVGGFILALAVAVHLIERAQRLAVG